MVKPKQAAGQDAGPRSASGDGAVIAVLLVLALALTYPTALVPDRVTSDPVNGEDTFIFCWNFWWFKTALLDLRQSPFTSPMLYWPHGVDLAYHTLTPLHSILSIPFQLVWPAPAGLYIPYNCFVILSFFLASVGMYLLARHVCGDRLPAFAAAIYYSYSNFRYANTTRLHVLSTEWFPFLLLALLLWLRTGRKRYAAATAGLALVVFYTSTEYAAYLMLLLPAFVLAWVWRRRQETRVRQLLRPASLACFALPLVVGVLPILPAAIAQRNATKEFVTYPPDRFIANLADYFLPNSYHPAWGEWSRAQSAQYHYGVSTYGLSLGYVAMALAAVSLMRRKAKGQTKGLGMWLFWAAVCLILALGPRLQVGRQAPLRLPKAADAAVSAKTAAHQDGPHSGPYGGADERPAFKLSEQMPYKWLWKAVPFIRSSRSVNRWIAFGQMFIGLMLALGAKAIMDRAGRRRNVAFGCLLGLLLFEQLGVPLPMMEKRIPGVYPAIAAHGTPGCVSHMQPPWCCSNQLYQTVHGQPLVDLVGFSMPAASRRAESLPIEETARSFWLYLLPRQGMEVQSADVYKIRAWPEGLTWEQRLAAAREIQRRFHLVYIVIPRKDFEYKGRVQVTHAEARRFLEALGPTRVDDTSDAEQVLFVYDQYKMGVDDLATPP